MYQNIHIICNQQLQMSDGKDRLFLRGSGRHTTHLVLNVYSFYWNTEP